MSVLSDFQGWVDDRVKDGAAFLSTAEKNTAIAQALLTYSKHHALQIFDDITGDGGYDYDLPSAWEDNVSAIRRIEYPAGEQTPVYLEGNDWQLYYDVDNTKWQLRFTSCSPSSTETIRLTFTGTHTVTAGASTVYANDEQAVSDLAASYALRKLAARQAQSTDPTIDADSVAYTSQTQIYTQLADRLLRQYREHLGVGTDDQNGGTAPATQYLDTDLTKPWGSDLLLHPSRWY